MTHWTRVNSTEFDFHRFRCTVGYEVWFSKSNLSIEWRQINSGKHTPFLVYHYAPDGEAVGLAGELELLIHS